MRGNCFAAMLVSVMLSAGFLTAEEKDFSRKTIDLGVVVRDLEKSGKFYTDVIGFTEANGFSVPAEFCNQAGLTDQQPLTIRVFVLGAGEDATKLKLMELPQAKPKPADQRFIHSQLGVSYLTIFVSDIDAALERIRKGNAKLASKGAVALPGNNQLFLVLVRDPDGNLIELIGPKK